MMEMCCKSMHSEVACTGSQMSKHHMMHIYSYGHTCIAGHPGGDTCPGSNMLHRVGSPTV
jgi:hypothetical protein